MYSPLTSSRGCGSAGGRLAAAWCQPSKPAAVGGAIGPAAPVGSVLPRPKGGACTAAGPPGCNIAVVCSSSCWYVVGTSDTGGSTVVPPAQSTEITVREAALSPRGGFARAGVSSEISVYSVCPGGNWGDFVDGMRKVSRGVSEV